jgi:hypothetical protein
MDAAIAPYLDDAEVQEADTAARTIADTARDLEIVDETTNTSALELLSRARKAVKQVEALRIRFVGPLNDQVKVINAHFKAMAGPASEADTILARKTAKYRADVVAAARAEEERLRKLAEARQERAVERAAERGLEPPAPPAFMPSVPMPARTQGNVGFRTVRRFEITDRAQIPAEYWTVNEVAIGAAVRGGIVSIPGVRIWETEEPVVR